MRVYKYTTQMIPRNGLDRRKLGMIPMRERERVVSYLIENFGLVVCWNCNFIHCPTKFEKYYNVKWLRNYKSVQQSVKTFISSENSFEHLILERNIKLNIDGEKLYNTYKITKTEYK